MDVAEDIKAHDAVVATFGKENLQTLADIVTEVAGRLDYRQLMAWRIGRPIEDLIRPIVIRTMVTVLKPLDLEAMQLAMDEPTIRTELDTLRAQVARMHDLAEALVWRRDPMAGRVLADLIRDALTPPEPDTAAAPAFPTSKPQEP